MFGYFPDVGLCHFEEVTEHLVVLDLQSSDAACRALLLEVGVEIGATVGEKAFELIELLIVALPYDVPLGQQDRRRVKEPACKELTEPRELLAIRRSPRHRLTVEQFRGHEPFEIKGGFQGVPDGHHILPVSLVEPHACNQPFDVEYSPEPISEIRQQHLAVVEGVHPVVARLDGGLVFQGVQQPLSEGSRTHGRAGVVHDRKERVAPSALGHVLHDLEVALRCLVEHHMLAVAVG